MFTSSTSLFAAAAPTVDLDPATLVLQASGPTALILATLLGAAAAAIVITVVKHRQLQRWVAAEGELERAVLRALAEGGDAAGLASLAERHPDAPGAEVLRALCAAPAAAPEILDALVGCALVELRRRLEAMMTPLASIGSAAPFVGLLGTVYGIMEAFLQIGREANATLPVVAPAIGEALIATAVGLFAAIPAVLAYNELSRRVEALEGRVAASAQLWSAHLRRAASTYDDVEVELVEGDL